MSDATIATGKVNATAALLVIISERNVVNMYIIANTPSGPKECTVLIKW